jgi:hypothetical protein
MKTYNRLFFLFLTVTSFFIFNSCEKNNSGTAGTGSAEFSVNLPADAGAKSATLADDIAITYQVMISVEDMAGNAVLTDKLIPVYTFGSAFVSENIELKTGEYNLTKFLVINPAGEVVYAAPKTGSPLAYLCNRPLPFNFSINANQVTTVLPEVLAVGDQTPDKFGYASFGIQIIKPLEFWTICILDNPLIMAPTQITTAQLTVYSLNGWHYTFKLEAAVNHLVIRGGSEVYDFVLEKEGYPAQKMRFGAKDLLATTKENPLVLKIPWGPQFRTIVLQPGPEKGKDVMISNLEPDKNFGDYKYFEATFLTEPVLTVMRSNRSLIFFNPDTLPKSAVIQKVTLKLTYDFPIPFDNTYVTDIYPSTGIVWYGGVLQQIIEPWEESKVTWNTQPKTTEMNQVYIPPFIRNVNMIEVDVTRLFISPVASALANHGMLFKLWPTDQFPGFRFASSDFSEPKMRPMLTIYYTL